MKISNSIACAELRKLISEPGMHHLVGAYDALSAKLVEASGFRAVHVGGYNLSASRLGLPDVGFLTMTEMVHEVRRVAAATNVPVIADGDDGYGNHLSVVRLIQELEAAGASGVHIEDQVFPKRCGHMPGKRIVPCEEFVSKIKAAVDTRSNGDFVVIARTDANAVVGFEETIDRACAYVEAGADVIFFEAPVNMNEVRTIPKRVSAPTLFNWCYGGRSPEPSADEIADCGYKFILFTDVLFAVAKNLRNLYTEIRDSGTYGNFRNDMYKFDEFNEVIGIENVIELDNRYS